MGHQNFHPCPHFIKFLFCHVSVCECVCVHVSVCTQILFSWSCRQRWAALPWCWKPKLRFSGRAASALSCSLQPQESNGWEATLQHPVSFFFLSLVSVAFGPLHLLLLFWGVIVLISFEVLFMPAARVPASPFAVVEYPHRRAFNLPGFSEISRWRLSE